MPSVVRVGDANANGGLAQVGVGTVLVNGRPISVTGNPVTSHACCGSPGCGAHCSASTTIGSSTVFAAGIPVQYVGCTDTCGHARTQGSGDVFVGA
jgi:uncharacterized Zn-binding protein involved in type VI secretion